MELKVSVCMITYNHEKYIAQAIESVLAQKTKFPVELVLGEDFSTDNTRNICISYKEQYPDRIMLRLPDRNLGMMPNFLENFKACKGKYIACLEGDDYWTDPLKLQKQVDFLEANPDYVMSYHNMIFEYRNGERVYMRDMEKQPKDTYSFEDFCWNTPIAQSASLVFRGTLFTEIPPLLYECCVGDWPLKLLVSEHGKTKYLDEVMGVYRPGGIGVGLKNSDMLINTLKAITRHYKKDYSSIFNQQDENLSLYWDAFSYSCQSGTFSKSLRYGFKVIALLKFSTQNHLKITRIGTIKRLIYSFISREKNA